MNKEKFIVELKQQLNLDNDKINVIENILEEHFIIGKKNKDKIINDFMERLSIDNKKANEIYETSMNIISNAIKNKIKHPFKSVD